MNLGTALGTLLSWPIVVYQKVISPALPSRCRYAPTCSHYAITALKTHGPIKGLILGTWRLLRCNPWSRGGVDYVPEKGHWKAPQWTPPDDWPGHLNLDPPFPMGLKRIDDWNDN